MEMVLNQQIVLDHALEAVKSRREKKY